MENNFLKDLKEQTDNLHIKAHKLEYFKGVFNHTLDKKCYIGQLRVLSIIYGALEREIESSKLEFPSGYIKKLPLLLKDIYFLEESKKENKEAMDISLLMADEIMIAAIKNPYALVGYLYTLEGSLQGGSVVAPHIIEQYDIKENKGVGYLLCYKNSLKKYWEDFKNYLVTNAKDHEELIIDSSNRCFEGLIKIYEALYNNKDKEHTFHSASLNPEAGKHNVPNDPEEIEAAINACKKCWYFYPYFEIRYGERGYRFGISSVAWQVTLNNLSLQNGKFEIDWLAKVLSNRGIPSIILEKQLFILYKELGSSEKYIKILNLAKHIKAKRDMLLDEKDYNRLASEFESMIDPEWVRKLKNIGELIISSLLDKSIGFENSTLSIQGYFEDENIFSKEFISEFQSALYKTQKKLLKHIKRFSD